MPLVNPQTNRTVCLGDVIAAAYDEVTDYTDDDAEASHLAALAVVRTLIRNHNLRAVRKLAEEFDLSEARTAA
jgi:hypothetical protein